MIAQTELTQQQKQNILRWYYTHPIKTDIPRPGESPLPKGKGDNDAWWEEGANLAEQAVASGNLRPEDESHLRVRPLPDNMRWPLRYPILVPATHCLMGEQDRDFFPSAAGLHNGGTIAFGADGYLYIGLGDGGPTRDPQNRAQTPHTFLGKFLRIDVNVPHDDAQGYRVPPDNPFLDATPIDALPEIWSFGVRNPWKFSFDNPALGGTGAWSWVM